MEGRKGLKRRSVHSWKKAVAAYQEVSWVAFPWGTNHLPNSSVYSYQVFRSFQNPGSHESLKSMRLLIAIVQVYSGRHFFPGTEKLMSTAQGSQSQDQNEHRILKRDKKRRSCPIATTKGRVSPWHRAWVCTAELGCLGFLFPVVQGDHFPSAHTLTHLHTVFPRAWYNSID